ncbi:alpha/beta fold hydrolase [Streptomyces sp. NPDC050504]|uniref:alpha/beta fold hydrolase n=1 Tax=Streptomyces sp. NPDC050504 TaxID=3365618 RepID=UPI0037B42615
MNLSTPAGSPAPTRFFTSYDGTRLAYHLSGEGHGERAGHEAGHEDRGGRAGRPVVCLPGGPMQDSAYLGDLGGLAAHRRLIRLDLRGTGASALPDDPASYRCDRLVDDVEALRTHLGPDRMDLLAHSAGANPALLYAARHPRRVGRLALITPSVTAVGLEVAGDVRRGTARLRAGEPWFPEAYAALEAVVAGRGDSEAFKAIAPFWYGRWDETARTHRAAGERQRNDGAAAVFAAEGAFAPEETRAALARLASPVFVLAGEVDLNSPPPAMTELSGLFPHARLHVQQGAGHFPWLDDAEPFASTVGAFLGRDAE